MLAGPAKADEQTGKFTVTNGEKIPIRISILPRNHCYQAKEITGITLLPGFSYEWGWWHAGPWRGCGGAAAEFTIVFDPPLVQGGVKNDTIAFWFDRGTGFGPLKVDNPYRGDFSADGGDKRFITRAGFTSTDEVLFPNETIILEAINGTQAGEKGGSTRSEETRAQERQQRSKLLLDASVGYDGAGASSKASMSAEMENSLKEEAKSVQESTSNQKNSWELKPGEMRITTTSADIVRTTEGNVYLRYRSIPKTESFVIKDDEASYSRILVGKHCLASSIDMLSGLKLVSPWKANSVLRRVDKN